MYHPTIELLMEYLNGRLVASEQREIETHLAACGRCQRELDVAHDMLAGMKGEGLAAPPPDLVVRTLSAFRRRRARQAQRLRWPADPRFDSWTGMGSLGTRETRRLFFAAEPFDLYLQIVEESLSDGFALRGRILGGVSRSSALEGIELCLSDESGVERRGLTNRSGGFGFSGLAEGNYSLQVILENSDIILDSVEIEGARTNYRLSNPILTFRLPRDRPVRPVDRTLLHFDQ